jgi:hypothetical protein
MEKNDFVENNFAKYFFRKKNVFEFFVSQKWLTSAVKKQM